MSKSTISPTAKIEERFWKKVKKDSDRCWLWVASVHTTGYGAFWLHKKIVLSHRVAYILTYGSIPDGLCVCHKCDTPLCCNPDHLFLGTVRDNNDDRVRKGRTAKSQAKLTVSQVQLVPLLYDQGWTQLEIANHLGVSDPSINAILRGKQWKDVEGCTRQGRKFVSRGEKSGTAKLNADQVREIRQRAKSGETGRSLALIFHVSEASVSMIVNHKSWIEITE